jgi:hypothetical protein
MYEHVCVVELSLGRRMNPGEVVHHRDHNKQNNALMNLDVRQAGEHSRHHRRLDIHRRRRDVLGRFTGNDAGSF